MQDFTAQRDSLTPDEIWLCEHPPVFTQGLAGLASHVLGPTSAPLVATNRGGQVTFHGPGQVVAYALIDLRRSGYFVKEYVYKLEEAVLRTLLHFGVTGLRVSGAPGVFVRSDNPFDHAVRPMTAKAKCPKISPERVAGEIIHGMDRRREQILIGQSRTLAIAGRFLPGLPRMVMNRYPVSLRELRRKYGDGD